MFFAIAVVTLALVLAFNVFCSGPLYRLMGIWGTAAAELGYAVLALAGASAMVIAARKKRKDGVDLLEIFSIRLPEPKTVIGGLLLVGASYFTAALYSNIINILFPAAVDQTVEGMQGILQGNSLAATVICVALFPAICEEVVFRGVLQYSLQRHGTPRIAILLTGVVFGLFHMDPIRIPVAAMTGIALCYALYRSRSILVPMLMHFANNAVSAVLSAAVGDLEETSAEALTQQIEQIEAMGLPSALLYMISGAELTVFALGLLIAGLALLEKKPGEALRKHWVTAVVLAAIILALGAGFIAVSVRAA